MMRESNSVVKEETLQIAKGAALLTTLSLIVCLCLGQLNLGTISGFLIGGTYAVFNFYRIGRTIEKSFGFPPHKAQTYMTAQYFIRYFTTALVIFIGIYVDFINYLGIIIPLIFPKLTLLFCKLIRKEARM